MKTRFERSQVRFVFQKSDFLKLLFMLEQLKGTFENLLFTTWP